MFSVSFVQDEPFEHAYLLLCFFTTTVTVLRMKLKIIMTYAYHNHLLQFLDCNCNTSLLLLNGFFYNLPNAYHNWAKYSWLNIHTCVQNGKIICSNLNATQLLQTSHFFTHLDSGTNLEFFSMCVTIFLFSLHLQLWVDTVCSFILSHQTTIVLYF